MEGALIITNTRQADSDHITREGAIKHAKQCHKRNQKLRSLQSRQTIMLKRRLTPDSPADAVPGQRRASLGSAAPVLRQRRSLGNADTAGMAELIPRTKRHSVGLVRLASTVKCQLKASDVGVADRMNPVDEAVKENKDLDSASMIRKFRFWSSFIIILYKLHRDIYHRFGKSNFGDQMEVIDNTENLNRKQTTDFHFNPSYYKANRQMRMSMEAKRILNKRPELRTEQEIQYAVIALRGIDLIADYPLRMQHNLAMHGTFECYEPKRAIVRQGHPAQAFYFILFGTVIVAILQPGQDQAKTVCYLHRGDSFGELALISKGKRQATVITKNIVELLSISVETYERIFMVGGARNVHDPDHNDFMESLWFLDGWPKHLLVSDPKIFVFSYFTRGAVMVKDSNYSEWIYIVKSGSVNVFKKLVKVKTNVSKRTGKVINALTESQKLDAFQTNQLSLLKRHKDFNLVVNLPSREGCNGDLLSRRRSIGSQSSDVDGDSEDDEDNNLPSVTLRMRRAQSAVLSMTNHRRGILHTARNIQSARGRHRTRNSPRKIKIVEPKQDHKDGDDEENDPNFVNQRRTYLDDLDAGYKAREHIVTEADRNPIFVHIQTLVKGQTLGLAHEILKPQPSLCLVSNGAECVMINKRFYLDHCSQALMRRLRQELSPYPSDEELQRDLLTRINWDTYRQATHTGLMKEYATKRTQPVLNGH